MTRAILIAATLLAAQTAPVAHAEERSLNVLLTGGPEANMIHVELSPDGRSYVIDSIVSLEVGGNVCQHPGGNPNELVCEAASISSFEVNAGGGGDSVVFSSKVPVPVTLRGGPGDDRLVGGAAPDKLIGGAGNDILIGRANMDWLIGGPGEDRLFGGAGSDVLRGGPGLDVLVGGSGHNELRQRPVGR
jgi:Ca2+-binding RTX toxin-like protein